MKSLLRGPDGFCTVLLKRIARRILFLGLGLLVIVSHDLGAKPLGNGAWIYLNQALARPTTNTNALDRSETWFRKAADLSEDRRTLQSGLGLTYHAQSQPERALTVWRRAETDPKDLLTHAQHSWAAEEYSDALLWLRYAKGIKPTWAEPYYWSGRIQNILQMPMAALVELQQAAALAPAIQDVWYEFAQSYALRQEWLNALDALTRAQDSPGNYGHVGLSNVLFEIAYISQYELVLEDTELAFTTYGKALEADDFVTKPWQKANAYYQRGRILSQDQQYEAASIEFERSLVVNPNAYSVRLSYARTLQTIGRHEEALSVLDKAIQLQPGRVEALVLTGDIYYWHNNFDAAQAFYMRAASIDPNNMDIRDRLFDVKKALDEALAP